MDIGYPLGQGRHQPHLSQNFKYKDERRGGWFENWFNRRMKEGMGFMLLQIEGSYCFRLKKKDGLPFCNDGDDNNT